MGEKLLADKKNGEHVAEWVDSLLGWRIGIAGPHPGGPECQAEVLNRRLALLVTSQANSQRLSYLEVSVPLSATSHGRSASKTAPRCIVDVSAGEPTCPLFQQACCVEKC